MPLRKAFVYYTDCTLEFNVKNFLGSFGLEQTDRSANFTYKLNGSIDLRNNPDVEIKEGAELFLENTTVVKEEVKWKYEFWQESSESLDNSFEERVGIKSCFDDIENDKFAVSHTICKQEELV